MRITWKDAVTTVSTGGAVVLERAYFHNYDWPLVSSMRWVIGGLAIAAFINLIVGFAIEWGQNEWWDFATIFGAVTLGTLTFLGLNYVVSDYVVAMMLSVVSVWLVSMVHHMVEHGTPQRLIHA